MGIYRDLRALIKGEVRSNELLSKHTSWRIGGPAEVLAIPAEIADLRLIIKYAKEKVVPLTIIGNGTNILASDNGVKGIVVKIEEGLNGCEVNGTDIAAGAGIRLAQLVAVARDTGIGGLEFLAGIPGTLGGAVAMNAGAHGAAISDILREVTVMDRDGVISRRKPGNLGLGYRTSNLANWSMIVLGAVLTGYPEEKKVIAGRIKNYLTFRKKFQPLDYPNAGSVFKNPPGHSAGKLIEEAGCKGLRVGDAQVSEKHANFIINLGSATAEDVLNLTHKVRERVLRSSGIKLGLEICILGR